MDNAFNLIRRPKREIVLCILFGGYTLFSLLERAGTGSLGTVGGVFSTIVTFTLLGGLIAALFMHNDRATKVLGTIIYVYFVVMLLIGFLPNAMDYMAFNTWAYVVAGIFSLFGFLALLGAMVFFVIDLFCPLSTRLRAYVLICRIFMLAFIGCMLMFWLFFWIGLFINGVGWALHMGSFANLFVFLGVFYGYFLLIDR